MRIRGQPSLVAYFWLGETREAVPYILALSAASFIYIATADLILGLNRQVSAAADGQLARSRSSA
jgi:zinc and cadmium transporter